MHLKVTDAAALRFISGCVHDSSCYHFVTLSTGLQYTVVQDWLMLNVAGVRSELGRAVFGLFAPSEAHCSTSQMFSYLNFYLMFLLLQYLLNMIVNEGFMIRVIIIMILMKTLMYK